MLHKEFWGLVFLGFVAWVILASNPQIRMARACEPVLWTGNIAASLTAFASADGASSVQKWGDKLDYGCRYTLWRLFYQSAYNKAMAARQNGSAPGAAAPAGTTAPPVNPAASSSVYKNGQVPEGAPVPKPTGSN